jgi:hypothetical protein
MKAIIALVVSLSLVGCSSAPKVSAKKPQYCYTTQEITVNKGDKVESSTMVECTDDEVKRVFHSRSGMAPNCGVFTYWTKIGGKDVQRKGISCQKPDGSWEVINTTGY